MVSEGRLATGVRALPFSANRITVTASRIKVAGSKVVFAPLLNTGLSSAKNAYSRVILLFAELGKREPSIFQNAQEEPFGELATMDGDDQSPVLGMFEDLMRTGLPNLSVAFSNQES